MTTLVVPRAARNVWGSIRKFRPSQFRSPSSPATTTAPFELIIDVTDPDISDDANWMDIEAEDEVFDEKLEAFLLIDDVSDQAERKWLMSGR